MFLGQHIGGPRIIVWIASDGSGYESAPCGCCPDSERNAS